MIAIIFGLLWQRHNGNVNSFDNKILERIRIIIETGADLDVWQKLGIK